MKKVNFELFLSFINEYKGKLLYLFTHLDPDGDAIGSTFSFSKILKIFNIDSKIILSNYDFPLFLLDDDNESFLLYENKKYFYYEKKVNGKYEYKEVNFKILEEMKDKKFITLDSSNLKRVFSEFEEFKKDESMYKKIENNLLMNIDHHFDNNIKCEYNFIVPSASSTSDIILEFIKKIAKFDKNKYEQIINDKLILTYLALGIIYDTYCFQNKNTNDKTFKNASFLYKNGADFEKAKEKVLKNGDKKILKIWGEILLNLETFFDDKIILAKINKAMLDKEGIDANIVSNGFINHLYSIRDSEVVIFIVEKEDIVKGSVRSKNDFAFKFCKIFDGGGHPQASGFNVIKNSDFNYERFIKNIKEKILKLGNIYYK